MRAWAERPDFHCEAEQVGTTSAVVIVYGELDMDTTSTLSELLDRLKEQGSGEHLVMDLAHCTFMDSAGLGALVRAQREIASTPLHVVLSETIDNILRISGLIGLFYVHSTRAEAVRALEKQVGPFRRRSGRQAET